MADVVNTFLVTGSLPEGMRPLLQQVLDVAVTGGVSSERLAALLGALAVVALPAAAASAPQPVGKSWQGKALPNAPAYSPSDPPGTYEMRVANHQLSYPDLSPLQLVSSMITSLTPEQHSAVLSRVGGMEQLRAGAVSAADIINALRSAYPASKTPDMIRADLPTLYKSFTFLKCPEMLVKMRSLFAEGQLDDGLYRKDILLANVKAIAPTVHQNVTLAPLYNQTTATFESLQESFLQAFHNLKALGYISDPLLDPSSPPPSKRARQEPRGGGGAGPGTSAQHARAALGAAAAGRVSERSNGSGSRIEGLTKEYMAMVAKEGGQDVCYYCHKKGHKIGDCHALAADKRANKRLEVRPWQGVVAARPRHHK
jgi:hypothetical protein